MDYMKSMWEASLKIAAAFAENKYTDKDGLVWLGIEGDTREEDCWLREDALVSMSSADMMKKMIYELNDWDEFPVEDPYEYAVQTTMISFPHRKEIVNGVWSSKENAETILKWRTKTAIGLIDIKIVKRRKAGKIQDV